jgi:Fur family ferric uptake transcriptional regulator
MPASAQTAEARARTLLAEAPGRITQPRIQVLAALLETHGAATHGELQQRLPGVDRVSLYRCLDWLCQHGFANQLSSADGVRRYGYRAAGHDHQTHPHFQCIRCGITECLPELVIPTPKVPRGYRLDATEVLAKGLCNGCRRDE